MLGIRLLLSVRRSCWSAAPFSALILGGVPRAGPLESPGAQGGEAHEGRVTFRIHTTPDGRVFRLVGRIRGEDLGDLKRHIAARGASIVLDLGEVTLVDLEGVRFLSEAEVAGAELRHCPPFIREWIERERAVEG